MGGVEPAEGTERAAEPIQLGPDVRLPVGRAYIQTKQSACLRCGRRTERAQDQRRKRERGSMEDWQTRRSILHLISSLQSFGAVQSASRTDVIGHAKRRACIPVDALPSSDTPSIHASQVTSDGGR